MAFLLGFSSSPAPKQLRETTTAAPTTTTVRPRARHGPLALVHPNGDVLGIKSAHLLEVGTASLAVTTLA
jgi:hypothetical protein